MSTRQIMHNGYLTSKENVRNDNTVSYAMAAQSTLCLETTRALVPLTRDEDGTVYEVRQTIFLEVVDTETACNDDDKTLAKRGYHYFHKSLKWFKHVQKFV